MDQSDETYEPVTYEHHDHVEGPFFHGTKAVLEVGDELVAGFGSNFEEGRVMNHVYFSSRVMPAAWGAQLASALAGLSDRGHIYVVEPLGPFEDDPNATNKRFPGNPTRSYRTRDPLRVVAELDDWEGHPPEAVEAMLGSLDALRAEGRAVIDD
ncbi:NAD(+)--rifampin ADP-ribosyltransferase [Nocardioides sp.]|uniref:NAD(+)--rifampin ADP-ribosyltransferase n=1 Tax=Nocardioides sp. TaxID=35761 RepID=UPI0025EE0948|nr:NAD(+)--rifampin ADP-ribosyltransferase [Nocardioides sp.]